MKIKTYNQLNTKNGSVSTLCNLQKLFQREFFTRCQLAYYSRNRTQATIRLRSTNGAANEGWFDGFSARGFKKINKEIWVRIK